MRVAAIDIGTNSTRLLIADVSADGAVSELERDSIVTRLGHGVDASGRLDDAACERVHAALAGYAKRIKALDVERTTGVATSAVRDAENGARFRDEIAARHGIEIRVIDGDEEAGLTFLGVTSGDTAVGEGGTVVVDIGGGSTEFIVGRSGAIEFHVSTQIGAVRQSERHLHVDPPDRQQLDDLSVEVHDAIVSAVPAEERGKVSQGIAVAGTPTVLASVDQQLTEFDPWKVHGYSLTLAACRRMLTELAGLRLAERRQVIGLHPDRAPTIVAGAAIIVEVMRAFDLEAIEVCEHDILYGLALTAAGFGRS